MTQEFQRLEASSRGLHYLVMQTKTQVPLCRFGFSM